MNILGISAFYHDSAACLVRDGEIVAAAQEERFSRKKHDASFPQKAAAYCLRQANLRPKDLDYVVFYDKPFLKFARLLETYLSYTPRGVRSFVKSMPIWIKQKIWIKEVIRREMAYQGKVLFTKHHEAHAASAFFPSPYPRAAVLTVDGVGEWTTTSFGMGEGNRITAIAELKFPHSLGLFYSAFTYYTGFKVNSGEYKMMGLAPYGEPKYVDLIMKELVDLKEDGSFRMNMSYFDYAAGLRMTSSKFHALFGALPRRPESPISKFYMDVACSAQKVVEDALFRMACHVHRETNCKSLCLAGGVALNCVANSRILREGPFDNVWIQPAAGDAGGALGATLYVWYQYLGNSRYADNVRDSQKGSYLGPEYKDEEILSYLKENNITGEKLNREDIAEKISDLIAEGKVVGWYQGRMEFGPRALGARSILGDARQAEMQRKMNVKIKFRESFRPFAPSIMEEKADEYFEMGGPSPYMLFTVSVKKGHRAGVSRLDQKMVGLNKLKTVRSDIPAVTHVDYSARVQSVNSETNSLYYELINKFYEKYGCPVIINTSFNVRGEPIVCTPGEAYLCFRRTDMDYLMMGSYLLGKEKQEPWAKNEIWKKEYPLD